MKFRCCNFRFLSGLVRRALATCMLAAGVASAEVVDIAWDSLPPLPPGAGQQEQPGVASSFVGIHRDALLVGGGANFPEKLPWEGGRKAWWPDLFVLENVSSAHPRWVNKAYRLPRPIAYGVSFSTPDGVVCVGGADATQCYADVFRLTWDPARRQVQQTSLPSLPKPLGFMAGAMIGNTIFVAGGQYTMTGATATSTFWCLDLSRRDKGGFSWTELPAWPGSPRILPVAAAQRLGSTETVYLFGGRVPHAGAATEILTDAYAFDVRARRWRRVANVGGGRGVSVMAATVAAVGDEILVFGGDRGDLFLELESHDLAIEAAKRKLVDAPASARRELEAEIARRLRAKAEIYARHPGFSRDVLAYEPSKDRWRVLQRAPLPLPVTTIAASIGAAVILPSGEVRPGVRTPAVIRATPRLQP